MYMDEEGTTLASEILHELKCSAKRWFILAMVELVIILAMAAGIVYYLTLPVDYETVTGDDNGGNKLYQHGPQITAGHQYKVGRQ